MSDLVGVVTNNSVAGGFRIWVSPPNGPRKEISLFRGAPILPTQWSWGDPFSEEVAALSCPQITLFDTPGVGDLYWLTEGADIDIVWQPMPGSVITDIWTWEGYIVSFDFSIDDNGTSFQVQLRGALYALDNYLALPTFPEYPLPYEFLLRSAFDPEQHPCSLAPLDVQFPDWWTTVAPAAVPGESQLLRPAGVTTGNKWTGLTTRSTGSWNPLLTGFASGLLQVMYNADGSQWTIRNRGGRSPQLLVREQANESDTDVLNVDLGAPGVDVSLSQDFSQMMQVIYGTGSDQQGVNYSGMKMSADGSSIGYTPFAFNPAAYPRSGATGPFNPLFNPQLKTRESYMAFQQGLTQAAAANVAQGQLRRLNDPGFTGTITLTTDPYLSDGMDTPFFRLLIKAGQAIRINGLYGIPGGVLFHITESQVDATNLSVSLTVDSKYRDLLTVEEVQARTMDPLKLLHSLQNGAQSNLIQDLLMPWSYAAGSGSIPYPATRFYATLPPTEAFPYSNDTHSGWCQQYPPSRYPEYYVRIPGTDQDNSAKNWADYSAVSGNVGSPSIPILMSAAGSASQIQMAAYDKDGNVVPVKFHLSLYYSSGVQVTHMPRWGTNPFLTPPAFPPMLGPLDFANATSANFVGRWPGGSGGTAWGKGSTPYPQNDPTNVTQCYHPFFQGAWQTTDEQGHDFKTLGGETADYAPDSSVGAIIGWGTYYVPAGFYPNEPGGGPISGMLVDTTTWTWDTTKTLNASSVNPIGQAPQGPSNAGRIYAMLYCEDQGQQDVYFMGRIYGQSQNGQ